MSSSLYRLSSRFPRAALNSLLSSNRAQIIHNNINKIISNNYNPFLVFSNRFQSFFESPNKGIVAQMSPLHHLGLNSAALQQFGFSSSTSSEAAEKENSNSGKRGVNPENVGAAAERSEDVEASERNEASSSEGPEVTNQKEQPDSSSDSDSDEEVTMEDLIKLVTEKEELLKVKHREIEQMQDKVIRSYAEMENVMDRTRREAENSKKFAIQNFVKSLLDVADNLNRASSVVKESFSKIDTSKDSAGAVPLLNTLLEGVEMTEKQLAEVFKKFGVEKYDPTSEHFDPHRHNAVFQVPDASKPPGTVAVVLKTGYVLHDRVIRPAEVGVTIATEAVDN